MDDPRTPRFSAGRVVQALLGRGVRRRSLLLAHVQAGFWSIGNALTTGYLITYLALELGAQGEGLGALLAWQGIVGLLRLATPSLVVLLGTKRRTTLLASLASYAILILVPVLLVIPGSSRWPYPVETLIAILCVHQLLENIAAVAWWSWLGDWIPPRVRGRYLAVRQIIQLIGIGTLPLVVSWLLTHWLARNDSPDAKLLGYGLVVLLGSVCLFGSLLPIWLMPEGPASRRAPQGATIMSAEHGASSAGSSSAARGLIPLLLFIAAFSLANGLTQSAQNKFPYEVLRLEIWDLQLMLTAMRVGQAFITHGLGPFSDRFGQRSIVIVCQGLIAAGLGFYALATPETPRVLWGAWICWIAFAGHNLCLPQLLLRVAPGPRNTRPIAAYFALSGLCFAVGSYTGGLALDVLKGWGADSGGLTSVGPLYQFVFTIGVVLRGAVVGLAWRLVEPADQRPDDSVPRSSS